MKYKSDIFEVVHENAAANFAIGAISEARMIEYDKMCLVEEPETTGQYENLKEKKPAGFIVV